MPSPYARQMGATITRLLAVFSDSVPDSDTHRAVIALASDPDNWGGAHRQRDRVRAALLKTGNDRLQAQYYFSEACLESLYNETGPIDAFDSVSPFWVVPHALSFAAALDISAEMVTAALRGDA